MLGFSHFISYCAFSIKVRPIIIIKNEIVIYENNTRENALKKIIG